MNRLVLSLLLLLAAPAWAQSAGDVGDADRHELPEDTIKLPATATIEDVQAAIAGFRPVAIHAGVTLHGSLTLPDRIEYLSVWGEGPRPVLVVPPGRDGITIASQITDSVVIEGLEVRGPEALGEDQGIRLRLNGNPGKQAKELIIRDCKVNGFDTLIEVVDDYARVAAEKDERGRVVGLGAPGRINLTIDRCILHDARGSDSHSAGVYVEGLASGVIRDTVIHKVGWTDDDYPGGADEREKRSHCVYAQQFGSPITVTGCWLSEPAAKGLEMRAGGHVSGCVFTRCPEPIGIRRTASSVNGCAFLDLVDTAEDEPRGRGIDGWSMPSFSATGNLFARRRGTLNQPAVKVFAQDLTVTDNVAIAWKPGKDFLGNDQPMPGNRSEAADPGVPAVDAGRVGELLSRGRGAWGEAYDAAAFVAECWEAVGRE